MSMFVGEVLEGRLTRTQCVLQSTASYVPHPHPHADRNPHQK